TWPRATEFTNRPMRGKRGCTSDCATRSRLLQSLLTRKIRTAFSSLPLAILTVLTPSAAFFVRPMAARLSRRFCIRTKTPAQPIWASVEANKNGGVYVSNDAGDSWKLINSDHRIGGRGPGAMGIAVAPDNPDVLYVANTTTWKSKDGGKTFVGFKGAPGGDDYQRIWISGENPQIIALSSDQGAVISVNGG